MVTALTEDLVLGCLSETSRVAKHETGHHRRRVPERLSRLLEGSFVATFRQQHSAVAIKEEEEEEARGEVGEVGGEVGDTRETKGEDIERRDGDGDGGDIITHQTSSDHRHLAPTNEEGWKKFNKIMLGRAVESSTSTSSFAHALIVLSIGILQCLMFGVPAPSPPISEPLPGTRVLSTVCSSFFLTPTLLTLRRALYQFRPTSRGAVSSLP